MLNSIDVKFIFYSARLGLISSANILLIADIALRVTPNFSNFIIQKSKNKKTKSQIGINYPGKLKTLKLTCDILMMLKTHL